MINKTAVDFLKERLPSLFEHDDNGFYAKIFEEGETIEKEQLKKAYDYGKNMEAGVISFDYKINSNGFVQFMKQTYGK